MKNKLVGRLFLGVMVTSHINGASGFTAATDRQRHSNRAHKLAMAATQEPSMTAPYRGMASVDLYTSWLDLVQNNHVVATTIVDDDEGASNKARVRYGVKLATNKANKENVCQEFVQQVMLNNEDDSTQTMTTPHSRIQAINATLDAMHQQSQGGGGVKYVMDTAGFVAQLQLIRTLRPPAAFSFTDGKTSSAPPAYEYEKDSFVVGPLRLPLRPRVAQLNLPGRILHTPWDVYHNVSPADSRGHFLLLPALQPKDASSTADDILRANCRAQALTAQDCHDLVQLVATIEPLGSLLLCFNSIGAGASQNHIHLVSKEGE